MTTASLPGEAERQAVAAPARKRPLVSRRAARAMLPALSLLVVLLAIYYFNPRAISYFGLNLMLNLAVPVALATIAEMCVITINDLDLSVGGYVGFIACVTATSIGDSWRVYSSNAA